MLVGQLGKGVEALAADNAILNKENCQLHQEAQETTGSKKNRKSTSDRRRYVKMLFIKEKDAEKIHKGRNKKEAKRAAKKAARSSATASRAQKALRKKGKGKAC